VQEAAKAHEEAKKDLEKQIQKKLSEGDKEAAAKMQQQLDKMNENAKDQQQMMQQLAENLGMAAKALQEGGDPKEAAKQLEKLAQDLEKMQEQLDQLENLQDVLDQLADAKDAMKCANCQGEGCAQCQGNGKGEDDMKLSKNSKGENARNRGRGQGLREEEETDKGFYDTRVAADPKAGQSVRIGDASGPNKAGKSQEAIKEEIRASLAKEPDALEDVTLPRDQRENAKQYFEKLRKGE